MPNRSDNFNRANSASSLGTPSDSGSAWVALSGTWGINSNQGYLVTDNGDDLAYLEASLADVTVQVTRADNLGTHVGICFRVSDVNNYWVWHGNDSGRFLKKFVSGSPTTVYSDASAINPNDVISVTASGSSITAYINGVSITNTTDSFNSTATKSGIYSHFSDGTGRWEDFSITGSGSVGSAAASSSMFGQSGSTGIARGSSTASYQLVSSQGMAMVSGLGSYLIRGI